jgi:uncharacterized protein YbaR (Trm112 family)
MATSAAGSPYAASVIASIAALKSSGDINGERWLPVRTSHRESRLESTVIGHNFTPLHVEPRSQMSDTTDMTYSPPARTRKTPQPVETTRRSALPDHHDDVPPAKVRCPQCASRLEVIETPSGARTVSVVFLAAAVENTAHGLESFMAPGAGPELMCPACRKRFDPAEPSSAIRPLKRK